MSKEDIEFLTNLGGQIIEPKDKKGKKYLCVHNFQGYYVVPHELIQYIADNHYNIVHIEIFNNRGGGGGGFYLLAEKQMLSVHSKKLILEKNENEKVS